MYALRKALVAVARRLDAKGILTATDGNLSIRLDHGAILITPSGSCKGMIEADDLLIAHADGRVERSRKPSAEIALHRKIYALRPDVNAVVHAHPPYATAYAVAGVPLDRPILSEVVLTIGEVPVVPYATPTRTDLAESVGPYLPDASALLLGNHGAVTLGRDIAHAGFLMETLEHVAQIDLRARMLGGARGLSEADVAKLMEIRRTLGM
jgi:L-fuculose-phosphate aldolase